MNTHNLLLFYRQDFPLKKMCYDKTEQLNGIQDTHSNSNFGQNHRPMKSLSPQPPAADPYAFSDEASSAPAAVTQGSMRRSRDDIFQRPSPFKVSDFFCFVFMVCRCCELAFVSKIILVVK